MDLANRLDYNSVTGVITWLTGRRAGKRAGTVKVSNRSKRYRRITIDSKCYYEHRIAWFLHTGSFPDDVIDHINGVGTDNRIKNLRSVSQSENCKNIINYKTRDLPYGVDQVGKKFIARVCVNKIKNHLGTFDTINEACESISKFKNKG